MIVNQSEKISNSEDSCTRRKGGLGGELRCTCIMTDQEKIMKASEFTQGVPQAQPAGRQSWLDCNGRWADGEHPLRDFFRPRVFVKNFLAGVVVTAGWHLLKGSRLTPPFNNPVSNAVRENI